MAFLSELMNLVEDSGLRHRSLELLLHGIWKVEYNIGLLCSSMVENSRVTTFASQYNAMQVAVDARIWSSESGWSQA